MTSTDPDHPKGRLISFREINADLPTVHDQSLPDITEKAPESKSVEPVDPFPDSAIPYMLESIEGIVQQLENASRAGHLAHFVNTLEPYTQEENRIVDAYREGALSRSPGKGDFRIHNFTAALRRFHQAVPTAGKSFEVPFVSWDKESATSNMVVVEGDRTVSLTAEQAIAASKWGIKFRFANEEDQSRFNTRLLAKALDGLIGDLQGIARIDVYFSRKKSAPRALLGEARAGARFEDLILDILREHEPLASRASIDQDVIQKTDLRIHAEGVANGKGCRAQVKYIADPKVHARELAAFRLPEEYVIISPITIADGIASAANFDPKSRRFHALDQALPEQNLLGNSRALGYALQGLFRQALQEPTLDPRGPAFLLPTDLRDFIRSYVSEAAIIADGARTKRKQAS
ncbi:MAG: hypothetical protein KDD70_04975 [Bdellovibrionales bacterium]|nr:hypothetical protein [Bdellovibrionales bacterium]